MELGVEDGVNESDCVSDVVLEVEEECVFVRLSLKDGVSD